MSNPLRDLFAGIVGGRRAPVMSVPPTRTLDDVILPPSTRQAIDAALEQVRNHALIFDQWGLGERHSSGLGLAFNFAGPPGTGKTICAEAIAHALGKDLLLVRYAELASMWVGETAKNVSAIFRAAEEEDAVLFFDEADAIAGRRFSAVSEGYQRETNAVVNVLLRELEQFNGVVIFATNMASNFDPAFERRIRTHIFFEMPGVGERARIWRVQLHAQKTPLADDVDFPQLAEKYARSGGDIKNAVLKAALYAAAEPLPDGEKAIHQCHFERAMEEVIAARKVMDQSLFGATADLAGLPLWTAQQALGESVQAMEHRLAGVERAAGEVASLDLRLTSALSEADVRRESRLTEMERRMGEKMEELEERTRAARQALEVRLLRSARWTMLVAGVALIAALVLIAVLIWR